MGGKNERVRLLEFYIYKLYVHNTGLVWINFFFLGCKTGIGTIIQKKYIYIYIVGAMAQSNKLGLGLVRGH